LYRDKFLISKVTDIADADTILRILGEALNLEYPIIHLRDGNQVDSTSQLIWPYSLSTWPKPNIDNPSFQDRFDLLCKEGVDLDKLPGVQRLTGEPPPLLVFDVSSSTGTDVNAPSIPYLADQKDIELNAQAAFEKVPANEAKYKLLSIITNHNRTHFTTT